MGSGMKQIGIDEERTSGAMYQSPQAMCKLASIVGWSP
jgi:hypothetical protein